MARCTTCGRQDFTFTGFGTEVCRGCGMIVHDPAPVRLPHVPQGAPIHSLTPAPPVFAVSDCHILNTAIADYIRLASMPAVVLPDSISVGDIAFISARDRAVRKVRSGRPTDPDVPISFMSELPEVSESGWTGRVSRIDYEDRDNAILEVVTISGRGIHNHGQRMYSSGRPALEFPCCWPDCSISHPRDVEFCAYHHAVVGLPGSSVVYARIRLADIHNVLRRLVVPIGVRDALRAKVEDEARLLTGRIARYASLIADAAALADRQRQQELREVQATQDRRQREAQAVEEHELALLEKLMQKFNVKAKLPDNVRGVEPGERHLDM